MSAAITDSDLYKRVQASAEETLEDLMQGLKGVLAGVVATSDGFEVAARTSKNMDASKLAATACSISALGAMVSEESEIGQYHYLMVEASEGHVVILEVAHPAMPMILNLVITRGDVLGQVLYQAKLAVKRLAAVG
jgi:uncharacterized protein